MVQVSGLFIYPVKSLRGQAVPVAELDALGFVSDRRFLVVDAEGKFLTQRTAPRMACLDARLSPSTLTLSAAAAGQVTVPRAPDPHAPLRPVTIWKSAGLLAEDCGDEPARWLSDFLGLKCGLVRIGDKFLRPVLKASARAGDVFTFADGCPFLLISEASLAQLNDRIIENGGDPVPMNRFRPNLVVTGCDAFAEDTWTHFRIGDIAFRSAGPSARCVITTTDQSTGARGQEPLKTLATFRRAQEDPTDVNFGVNLIHETKRGTLRVGHAVTLG